MSERLDEAKRYNRIKIQLKLFGLFFVIIYLLAFQLFLSSPLENLSLSFTTNFYYAFTVYLIIFSLLHYALHFPLDVYSGFTLEHKFKLSKQNFFSWFIDDIKEGILSLFVFLIFVHALYILLRKFDTTWWIWMAVFWFFVTIVITKITPILVIPLFFKYQPVRDELKNRILELSKKCNIKILNVYKIDFSKKTTKLNAAVVGMGNTRRVILADNLVNEFTGEEVEGVLAHEFGHHKLRHIAKLITFGILSTFLSFYILYIISARIAVLLHAGHVYDIRIFPAFMLVLFITSFLMMPLANSFSRKLEREADLFALRITQNKDVFISLMQKLADKNLADPNPAKIIKFLFYSHPPISERIEMARKF